MALDLTALDDVLTLDDRKAVSNGEALKVPYELVYEDPDQPRKTFRPETLSSLAADIARNGVLMPIVVWPRDERGYKIRHGARRRRAAEIAAKTTGEHNVPVVIRSDAIVDDYAQFSENLHREDISALDAAKFIQGKLDLGAKVEEVAKNLSIARQRIPEYLAALRMPPVLRTAYEQGRVTSARTIALLVTLHDEHPDAVAQLLADPDSDLTRSAVEALREQLALSAARPPGDADASAILSQTTPTPRVEDARARSKVKKPAKKDSDIARLETRMTESLGARSSIRFNKTSGRGTIAIRFTSVRELEGLLERFRIPKDSDDE